MEIQSEIDGRPKGSFGRYLALTRNRAKLFAKLNELVKPFANFDTADSIYFPQGEQFPKEAKLGDTEGLLTLDQRETVTSWWLAVRRGANTPNWDIAAKCSILGKPGLILVEAKAHQQELDFTGIRAGNSENKERITEAVSEANCWLNAKWPVWNLSVESKYRLSNRFAWSWKLASLGVPVILVYLGFLNAEEMKPNGKLFSTPAGWDQAVRDYSKGVIPDDVWGPSIEVNGTPFLSLIRSCEQSLPADS